MDRHDLTDGQWERLRPLLPPQKPPVGRPNLDHRAVINGILWVARTGAPWRDLPERYGVWSSLASRFYRWRKAGIWQGILAALQQRAEMIGGIDWEVHFVDGTIVRAHQHAAGAKGSTAMAEGLGRSQGGFSTKIHIRAEGGGKPITFVLTPGQRHESTVFEQLLEQGTVKHRGPGRPRRRPERVIGDKGYSAGRIRRYLRRHGIRITIPRRRDEHRRAPFDRALYRLRNLIERLVNRMKQFRRLATRYEKRADSYLAFLTVVAILLWL
jgi:transposase